MAMFVSSCPAQLLQHRKFIRANSPRFRMRRKASFNRVVVLVVFVFVHLALGVILGFLPPAIATGISRRLSPY